VGDVETVLKPGRPAEAGGGPPSGLGYSPRCRTALVALGEGRPAMRSSAPYSPAWRVEKLSNRQRASVTPIETFKFVKGLNYRWIENLKKDCSFPRMSFAK
jgi:hypothetical protein